MNDDSKSTFKITFDGIGEHNLFETWSESNQNKITSQVMAKVNKFLADQTVKKGRFALPFLYVMPYAYMMAHWLGIQLLY